MKLNMLSLAVLAAASLPVTFAFAEGHSQHSQHIKGPTVYGKVNISLELATEDSVTGGVVTEGDGVWEVRDNSTRLGIKGEEDLGGITGLYQYEFDTALTDGSGIGKNRTSFLGLKGNFGTVMAGRLDTPFKKAQGKVDLFGDGQLDMSAILGGEEREANVIGYKSNKFNGMSFYGVIQPGEGTSDNEGVTDGVADAVSMSVQFESDELFLAFAYDMNVAWGFYDKSVDPILGTTLDDDNRTDAFRLTGVYKLDNMGFGAMFQSAEQTDIANPLEQTALVLSSYVQMDQTKFKAQYAMSEHELGAVSGMDFTQLSFGVDQKLSKSTVLYAAYQMRELDRGQFVGDTTEVEANYFAVGAVHSF